MLVYHTTPAKNRVSIKRRGLLTSKSQGKLPAIWLTSAGKRQWAIRHVQKRHGTKEVIVLGVDVPRQTLRRVKRGIWISFREIPAGNLSIGE
jgi:hypothetical protein